MNVDITAFLGFAFFLQMSYRAELPLFGQPLFLFAFRAIRQSHNGMINLSLKTAKAKQELLRASVHTL
jgi:hypothetical protein